jgi:predicted transcriptional regulator
MKIKEIRDLLEAKILCGEDQLETEVEGVFASDFMSDILAFTDNQKILITGMINPQVIRTAEMVDIQCIVFVRGKVPTAEIIALAEECGMVVLASSFLMYSACGVLYSHEGNPEPCRV